MMRILSLGWGVQSFTLAAMAALGEIEPIEYAIHADTTHESQLTYDFAKAWTPWLEERGVKVITTYPKNAEIINKYNFCVLPLYIPGGQTRRQCTKHWKLIPIRRMVQKLRDKQPVEQLIGISFDEFQRMRDSDIKYITNVYPLVEKRMKREGCKTWLRDHGLEVPPKSSCVFCPYHDIAAWRQVKSVPDDWDKAVAVDKQIRNYDPKYEQYLTNKCVPIDELDLRTMEEKGQMSIWENECTGMCGV